MILTSEKISELKKRVVTTVKIKNQSNSIKKAVNSIGNDWDKIRIKNQWWDAEEKNCLAKKIKNGGRLVKEITSKKKKKFNDKQFCSNDVLNDFKKFVNEEKSVEKVNKSNTSQKKIKNLNVDDVIRISFDRIINILIENGKVLNSESEFQDESAWKFLQKILNEDEQLDIIYKENAEIILSSLENVSNLSEVGIEIETAHTESQLFKTAFEAVVGTTHGLSENQINAWLINETGLAKNGTEEGKVFQNGWTDPTIIKGGVIPNYSITSHGKTVSDTNIDVKTIDKSFLDLAYDIWNDIVSKTDADDLPDDFRDTDFTTLNGQDNKLPAGRQHQDLVDFFYDHKNYCLERKFITEFQAAGGLAAQTLGKSDILDYWIRISPDGTEYCLSGTDAGNIFRNGWLMPNEIVVKDDGDIIVNYGGCEWNPLTNKRNDVINTTWINDFIAIPGTRALPVDNDEILAYKQGNIPVATARQIYDRHWVATEFTWNGLAGAIIDSYTSHNQTDTALDPLIINKLELDKVNDIINQISQAQTLADLPPRPWNYDENQVPTAKSQQQVQVLWNNQETQINAANQAQQDRLEAINRIKIYWQTLNMSGAAIEAICGNDWEKNFDNLVGTAITDKENRLKTLIKEVKVQPEITAIEAELNKKPVIANSELKTPDYRSEMLGLAGDDAKRTQQKDQIINEIDGIRKAKLDGVRIKITKAKEILEKTETTKEELETAVNDLKVLANDADGAEQIVWVENKDANQKLLTDLEDKLKKITPPEPEKEEPNKPRIPTPPPSPTPQEEKEKFGEDYANLKPTQQEGRQKIVENWKKEVNYARSKTCHYCPQEFHYDKSLEFLAAQAKVESKLKTHESNCSHKDNSEAVKKIKQDNWEQVKKSQTRHFYACRRCWGKIELDKSISDWDRAKQQARADLAYHEEHECGSEGDKKIAIYFSPNQGGNKHADLTYAKKINESELILEKDNQGEVYREQENNKNDNETDWTPWIVGGSVLAGVVALVLLVVKLGKKMKKKI